MTTVPVGHTNLFPVIHVHKLNPCPSCDQYHEIQFHQIIPPIPSTPMSSPYGWVGFCYHTGLPLFLSPHKALPGAKIIP